MLQVLVLVATVLAKCDKIEIFKEWREISTEEQKDFLGAIKCLRTRPNQIKAAEGKPQPTSRWEDFVYSHYVSSPTMHRAAPFLPWHRAFLRLIDKSLREECHYNGTLPYWDWTIDSEAPEKSEIWKSFGTTDCITMKEVGQIYTNFPMKHCVSRESNTLRGGSLFSPEQLGLIYDAKDYNEFTRRFENGPHNVGHISIGGDMRRISQSVNDPIFVMHHRNVDRIWRKWQKMKPENLNSYNGNVVPRKDTNDAKPTDKLVLTGFLEGITVQDVLDTTSGALNGLMCYDFSNSITPAKKPNTPAKKPEEKPNTPAKKPEGKIQKRDMPHGMMLGREDPTTPPQSDRTNMFNLRPPTKIPQDFLVEMKTSEKEIAEIRKAEEVVTEFTKFINTMPLVFQTSLERVEDGEKYGWIPKSDEQAMADDQMTITLVMAFKERELN